MKEKECKINPTASILKVLVDFKVAKKIIKLFYGP